MKHLMAGLAAYCGEPETSSTTADFVLKCPGKVLLICLPGSKYILLLLLGVSEGLVVIRFSFFFVFLFV